MSAHLLATFCLMTVMVCPGWGSSKDQPENGVVVYLSGRVQPPGPLNQMRLEVDRLMSPAGYRIEWRDVRDRNRSTTDSPLIVVELRGTCVISDGTPVASRASLRSGPLASTAVSDGRILPFSSVDCQSLTRLLSSPLAAEPAAKRDLLYGRAMGRLIAHELYHVLLGTRDHSRMGIARSSFDAASLLAGHFEFAPGTLAKLRPTSPAASSGSAEDETTDR